MTTVANAKVYTLSDGSRWTAATLGLHLGISATGARSRLNSTDDVDEIMRKTYKKARVSKNRKKTVKLSDGSKRTIEQHAEALDVNISTLYARLKRGERDPVILGRRPIQGRHKSNDGFVSPKAQPKSVKEDMKERMAYNPNKFWQLFAKFT